MAPQKSQENMKGKSSSPFIQNAVDTAWGAQNKDSNKTAQAAIADQHNQHPVDLAKGASTTPTKS